MKRRKSLKPVILIVVGAACVLSLVFGYEASHGRSVSAYFTPNAAYILKVGAKPDIRDLSLPDGASARDFSSSSNSLIELLPRYLAKIPCVLTGYEMPNNVNYYFSRPRLFPLNLAIPRFSLCRSAWLAWL